MSRLNRIETYSLNIRLTCLSIYIKMDILFIQMDIMNLTPASTDWKLPDLTDLESSALAVVGVATRYPAGHIVPEHRHRRGHLIYAAEGILRVEATTGRWLVPPTAAVWLRPEASHRLTMPVAVQVQGIYIHKEVAAELPSEDCVLQVSPLLRELISVVAHRDDQHTQSRRTALLGDLLVEELRSQPRLPFHLPWPGDPEMQQVCQALAHDPGDAATAEMWAGRLAMSTKTFYRRFQKSTGVTFGKWRQQIRLMSSLAMLLQGAPITQIALSSGYESHSAYATSFRKHFGCSPSAFVAANGRE
jgi:AraC-like DNA-binding protein